MKNNNLKSKDSDVDNIFKSTDKLWEILKHIDSIREGRNNFFIVAESMMIAAYMALISGESILKYAVSILGMIYTISWFFINLRQSNRIDWIMRKIRKNHKAVSEILNVGKGISGKIFINYVLPISTGIFWLLLIMDTAF